VTLAHLLAKPGRHKATAGLFIAGAAEAILSAACSRGSVPRHCAAAQLTKEEAPRGRMLAQGLPTQDY